MCFFLHAQLLYYVMFYLVYIKLYASTGGSKVRIYYNFELGGSTCWTFKIHNDISVSKSHPILFGIGQVNFLVVL